MQRAKEYADSFRYKVEEMGWHEDITRHFTAGFAAALGEGEGWVSVLERLPTPKLDSETVLAVLNGTLAVMSYAYIQNEGWVWANCYGDIDGDGEYDDEYKPTHWMPLPKNPTL